VLQTTTSKAEFDFQWANIPCELNDNLPHRIEELLDLTKLPRDFFRGKLCLDAGCGSGRYTWAMQQLGAKVDSIDISSSAIERCKQINPNATVKDILKLEPTHAYDFVFSFGVIHHCANPREAFTKLASQVKPRGLLYVMLYHKDTQEVYHEARRNWSLLTESQKVSVATFMAWRFGGHVYGWFDALNPLFNWAFSENEVKRMFIEEGFTNIKLVHTFSKYWLGKNYNVCMIGEKR